MPVDAHVDSGWEWRSRVRSHREAYRQQLIAKGVIDGSSKMHRLMERRRRKGFVTSKMP